MSAQGEFGKSKSDETQRRGWLRQHKPHVHEKVLQFNDKLARGEGVPIIQFQYNYQCNFKCRHCSIEKFQLTPGQEREQGKRAFTIDDVRELSRQADEMGLSTIVITGGEPLLFPDFDDLVAAIDPQKFWVVTDTNGWLLDEKRARHLKEIGVDKVQLSLDGGDAATHDNFRRQAGSWERCIRAVEACKKADLHVILSTVVWRGRAQSAEFHEFLELAKRLEVGTYVSYAKAVGAYEGRYDQLVTSEDTAYMRELEKRYDVFTHLTPSYGMDIGCIAVKRILPITRYGDVMPCPYTHVSLGNFFTEPLKDIVARGLNLKWFDPKAKMPCLAGEDRLFIDQVMAPSYGNSPVPVPYDRIFKADDYVDPARERSISESNGTGETTAASASRSPAPIEMIENGSGQVVPITWAPPEDTHYQHQLNGRPSYVEDAEREIEIWDAPSNQRDREGKLQYQRQGGAPPRADAGRIEGSVSPGSDPDARSLPL